MTPGLGFVIGFAVIYFGCWARAGWKRDWDLATMFGMTSIMAAPAALLIGIGIDILLGFRP